MKVWYCWYRIVPCILLETLRSHLKSLAWGLDYHPDWPPGGSVSPNTTCSTGFHCRCFLEMYFFSTSNKVPIGSKGDISHWRPLSGQKVTTRSSIVTSDIIFTEHSLTFCLKWRYIKRKRVFTVYQCMGICPLWMFWSNSILFYGHAGSIEDRRYLRHEILNEDIEYNVIVTTWVNAYNDDGCLYCG